MSIGSWRVMPQMGNRGGSPRKPKPPPKPLNPLTAMNEKQQGVLQGRVKAMGTLVGQAKNNLNWMEKALADTVLDHHKKNAAKSGKKATVEK